MGNENDRLKSLILVGKSLSPTVTVIVGCNGKGLSAGNISEEQEWVEGGQPAMGLRPIGFVPSRIRADLFPNSNPDPIMGIVGDVDVHIGRFRIDFTVQQSGSALPGLTSLGIEYLRVSASERDTCGIIFEARIVDKLDALELYHGFARAYKNGLSPLRIRSNAMQNAQSNKVRQLRTARISVSLEERQQISATALIRELEPTFEEGGTIYTWNFDQPPSIVVTMPGGLH